MTDIDSKASPDSTMEPTVENLGDNVNDEKQPVIKSPRPKQEKTGEKEAEADGDDDGDGTEKKALFEVPLVMEGKRERKKTERLSEVITKEKNEELEKSEKRKTIVVPEGSGTKLGDIPYIEYMLLKTKQEDLNLLHRCLYGINGDSRHRKSNIRKFCGFTFTEGSPEYEKKLEFLNRIFRAELTKQFHNIIGLKHESKKEDMTKTALEFFLSPKDLGKKPPQPKRKKSASKKTKKSKSKGEKKKKQKKTKEKTGEGDDEDAKSDSDESDSDEGSDTEDSPPKKKAKKSPAPKKSEKKSEKKTKSKTPAKKKDASKGKETPKKKSTKKSPAKPTVPVELSPDTSDLDSDDEPLVKKMKTKPTDDDIKDLVNKILDSSSLEDLSIRKVFQQVQDSYPDFDLSDKQKFVKTTVKELIN